MSFKSNFFWIAETGNFTGLLDVNVVQFVERDKSENLLKANGFHFGFKTIAAKPPLIEVSNDPGKFWKLVLN